MGRGYYRIVSSRKGVIVPIGAINAVSLNFYRYLVSYSKWLRNFIVEQFCMKNNLDYIYYAS